MRITTRPRWFKTPREAKEHDFSKIKIVAASAECGIAYGKIRTRPVQENQYAIPPAMTGPS
jgi:hypothetical protein